MSSLESQLVGAAKTGDLERALRLITAGANVNALDDAGGAPLHYAAGEGDADMVRLLLSKGADPDLPSDNMFIGFSAVSIACLNDYIDVMRALRQHGADFSGAANGQISALHHAASGGRTQMCAALLGMGIDVNVRDKDGWTPLHWATSNEKIEMIEFLFESGADLEAQDKDGRTALVHATESAKIEAIEALLRLGANIPQRLLEDGFLDAVCGDAAPDERAWINKGVRIVRAAAISRGLESAFPDDDEMRGNLRAGSSAPTL